MTIAVCFVPRRGGGSGGVSGERRRGATAAVDRGSSHRLPPSGRPERPDARDRAEPPARPLPRAPVLAAVGVDRRSRPGRCDRPDQGRRRLPRRSRKRPRRLRRPDDRRRAASPRPRARLRERQARRLEDRPARGRRRALSSAGVESRRASSSAPALDALSPRERRIVALRFYRDLSQQRIAAEVGLSQVQVSRVLSSSLAKMRDRLEAA